MRVSQELGWVLEKICIPVLLGLGIVCSTGNLVSARQGTGVCCHVTGTVIYTNTHVQTHTLIASFRFPFSSNELNIACCHTVDSIARVIATKNIARIQECDNRWIALKIGVYGLLEGSGPTFLYYHGLHPSTKGINISRRYQQAVEWLCKRLRRCRN